MRNHSSDCPPQDLAGGSEVVRTVGRVAVHPLPQECEVFEFVSVERSRNVQELTSGGGENEFISLKTTLEPKLIN